MPVTPTTTGSSRRKKLLIWGGSATAVLVALGVTLGVLLSEGGTTPGRVGSDSDWAQLAGRGGHFLAIKTNGSLWAWGFNIDGELGDGTTISRWKPGRIGSDLDWAAVSGASGNSLALKQDGSLWAWGAGAGRLLGDGTTVDLLEPTRIGSDSDWAVVNAGGFAVKTDGTLWTVGDGIARIGHDSDWAMASSYFALKTDGSLWQMGASTDDLKSPVMVRVGADSDWASVGGNGVWGAVAVKTDGSLWTWGGDNSCGQLGDGTTVAHDVPARVGSDSDWAMVNECDSSFPHCLALKTDGSLWAWGMNGFGQLGIGTSGDSESAPVRVGSGADWATVCAGGNANSAGIKTDGSLWYWGKTE
jgi:alpha-tubulin suppressor-like RCC1 family protein